MVTLVVICFILVSIVNGVGYKATFTEAETGISGYVTVNNQNLKINLDLSNVNQSIVTPECYASGFGYHMHFWNLPTTTKEALHINGACGPTNTGGHYDPFGACGSASGYPYCGDGVGQCIPKANGYVCDQTDPTYPFKCEIGDWSGKYGALTPNGSMIIELDETSFWEVDNALLASGTYSIVFHCSGGARIFCALFEQDSSTAGEFATQTVTKDNVTAIFDVFGDDNYVAFYPDGSVKMMLDASGVIANLTSVTECAAAGYSIAIFNSYTDTTTTSMLGSSCADIVGKVFDPTNSCYDYYSDSPYCNNMKLCNDSSYSYSCTSGFTCAPGDLSATPRYAKFLPQSPISTTYTYLSNQANMPIPFGQLLDKSIVIYCPDNDGTRGLGNSIIACAKLGPQSDVATPAPSADATIYNSILSVVIALITIIINV